MKVFDLNGKEYFLGKEIARGGEGILYTVLHEPGLVAKIYHAPKPKEKLLAMLKLATGELLEVAAWPLQVLIKEGMAIGFLCKRIKGGKEIHLITHPKDRKKGAPKITWGFLIQIARNLAALFDIVHQNGITIGDVNDRNFFVFSDATVQVIDCDSFHISSEHPCTVGMPLYLPPEPVSVESDRFALAVLIFQLLFMGRHPFAGSYIGQSEMGLVQAIHEGYFCFSKKVRLPRHALPFHIIPKSIQNLFLRAFSGGERPAAGEWIEALAALKEGLSRCPQEHDYFGHRCCWCDSSRKFQIDYFSKGAPPSKETLIGYALVPLIPLGFCYCPFLCLGIIVAPFVINIFTKK